MIDANNRKLTSLINKEFGLPKDYIPDDLVVPNITFSFSGYQEKKLLRQIAAEAIEELFQAAREQNLNLFGVSGYRSYTRQLAIYNENIAQNGAERTNLYSAKAGHSEHQSGLCMDVSTPSIHNRLDTEFAATPEGKFIAEHAHEYGFILRYPKDKSDITRYAYEPWHIRYVGKELSSQLFNDKYTLDEYYMHTPSILLRNEENS